HFAETVTIGPIVLRSISQQIHDMGGVIDCHLMTDTPENHFKAIKAAGGDSVTVHIEACADLYDAVQAARAEGLQVGMAFKPETDAAHAARAAIVAGFDLVLCMSIEPGYSGEPFMSEALDRIRAARRDRRAGGRRRARAWSDGVRDDGAVCAPRSHAAMRGRFDLGRRYAGRRRMSGSAPGPRRRLGASPCGRCRRLCCRGRARL